MMGRTPCCNVDGLKKGAWTSEEDQKLIAYIQEHGEGGWRTLPQKAGLQRCGKSCRLRWANYLRPDIKRGEFSPEEEDRIIELHASLGNRYPPAREGKEKIPTIKTLSSSFLPLLTWSAIARHLPRRTDNEIKNYWNTHLKKRLLEKGIHPTTHKPISPTAGSSSSSDDAVPSLSGNNTPTAPPAAGQEQPQLVPAQAHVSSSSSSSFPASASASAQLLNKLAAKLAPPPPHASSRFSAEQEDEVEEGANGVVEDDAPTKPRRRPASSSSSAKLLNKMASRLAHPLHCLNTLKSILSSAAASDRTNLMMHRSASASSLSESTAATTSNNDLPAQTASSKPDQLAFLESLDLDVLNDWHDPQQYDPLIMDFLADSITSKEKQEQPYHYYEEDSSLLPSLYGSHAALHSPAYFHDAFRAPAEDEHNFMDFDGPSTSASRNNDPADDPHCGGGYVVDNQVAADDAYGHHQFEYQHGAGGLLDGDDEHGRTLFNHYGDFRVDAASFF
ncbi:unnamed protein product [Linum tenue]|uniref:Uncharacterized protein n=1 Tax=Linum tenue TaxID=586396 RepID=A0AAV0RW13_9ROSI|nr:unnamed protein product [Linum tenue]